MNRLSLLLSLKPILYGLIGMLISGISFPLCGVIIVRNNLIPMRYMLMHGIILGGVFSIAFKIPLTPVVIAINLLLVFVMLLLSKNKETTLGYSSTAMMVFTMALSSLLCHVFDVPAKDTMELLWGSPFTLNKTDLVLLAVLAVVIICYIIISFKAISMVFFDAEIASSLNVNVKRHNLVMLLITALVISVSMKMLGALLIDALVVLPVISISKNSKSLKEVFIKSSVSGFILSALGYFLALIFNLPVSGLIALLSVVLYITDSLVYKLRKTK